MLTHFVCHCFYPPSKTKLKVVEEEKLASALSIAMIRELMHKEKTPQEFKSWLIAEKFREGIVARCGELSDYVKGYDLAVDEQFNCQKLKKLLLQLHKQE
ncbi:MAG: hypothetical protein R3Y07_02700 [Eubacteriales bacterium]